MYTREQYLKGECTHRQYYAQFVGQSTRATVLQRIGPERLLNSTDKHLNDIPLKEWDSMPLYMAQSLQKCGAYLTSAGKVCILKEAAQQLIDEFNAPEPVHKVNAIKKQIHIGDRTYITIKFRYDRLSITGVTNPDRFGNADACGQIGDSISITKYSAGWNAELLSQLLEVWEEYHLNDMQPGNAEQMELLKGKQLDYENAKTYLESLGKAEGYGTAWYKKSVPDSVIAFLESLPLGDKIPPTVWQD